MLTHWRCWTGLIRHHFSIDFFCWFQVYFFHCPLLKRGTFEYPPIKWRFNGTINELNGGFSSTPCLMTRGSFSLVISRFSCCWWPSSILTRLWRMAHLVRLALLHYQMVFTIRYYNHVCLTLENAASQKWWMFHRCYEKPPKNIPT